MATEKYDPAAVEVVAQPASPRGIPALLWARLLGLHSELFAEIAKASGGVVTPTGDGPGLRPVSVLDCGGGSGSLAVPLAAHGAQVTVVDISIDALATLVRRATEAGVAERVHAIQGDVEALSDVVQSTGFDLVLAHGLLESLTNRAEALVEISRVLRPGGIASLLVANPVAAVLGRLLVGDAPAALQNFQRSAGGTFRVEAIVAECVQAGLEVDSAEGIGVFTELIPGIELERPGMIQALAELEVAAAGVPPYRDIASRLHIVARRLTPAT